MSEAAKISFAKLYRYLQQHPVAERFCGYDPFDGLNSPLISKTLLGRSRFVRLAWVQFFKRSPVNLRKLALIKPGHNPQALGLFLSSYALLYKKFKREEDLNAINFLIQQIKQTRITGYHGACWGYNFAWQARAFYQPQNTPMIVPTTAVFNGLVDAFKVLKNQELIELAVSVAPFITKGLNRTYEGENFGFSYSPADKSVIYNASLMASQILATIFSYTKNRQLLPDIEASVRFCLEHQHPDGHWTYGTKPYHQWVDNFHTGYNLENLAKVARHIEIFGISQAIDRGFDYYISTFFDEQGRCKYYAEKTYPVDINNPAQLLSTLVALNRVAEHQQLAGKVIDWTANHLQDEKGYFYYQQHSSYTNKINYIRWSQAWMFYSLAQYLFAE